jgi:hypothetical protein
MGAPIPQRLALRLPSGLHLDFAEAPQLQQSLQHWFQVVDIVALA